MPTLPIVNLNGDRRETLVDQKMNVAKALGSVMQALQQASPHGRNYQLNQPGDLESARAVHKQRTLTIYKLLREFEEEGLAIADNRTEPHIVNMIENVR